MKLKQKLFETEADKTDHAPKIGVETRQTSERDSANHRISLDFSMDLCYANDKKGTGIDKGGKIE
ncbi:MAG: hypothetical protein IJ124_02495 [Clostridia bacterium]|nr:hypothetical protein [Clostridia bacterium]